MTDLEMTRLAAEAMGYLHHPATGGYPCVQQIGSRFNFIEAPSENQYPPYDPLHDDAQAMALARRFPLVFEVSVIEWANHVRRGEPFDVAYDFCKRIAKRAEK